MKRALILGAMALGVLAIPTLAAAESDCTYATGTTQTAGPVTVYADTDGSAGTTGEAAVAAGACADNVAPAAGFDGGFVEAGAGENSTVSPDGYAVIDGSDSNIDPAGQSDGYVGVSNFETSNTGDRTTEAECETPPPAGNGPDNGEPATSNSGGCLGVDGVGWVYVPGDAPTPVCGNTSGNSFDGSGTQGAGNRDGCSIP